MSLQVTMVFVWQLSELTNFEGSEKLVFIVMEAAECSQVSFYCDGSCRAFPGNEIPGRFGLWLQPEWNNTSVWTKTQSWLLELFSRCRQERAGSHGAGTQKCFPPSSHKEGVLLFLCFRRAAALSATGHPVTGISTKGRERVWVSVILYRTCF